MTVPKDATKNILHILDDQLNTSLYRPAAKLKRACDDVVNLLRCHVSYWAVRSKFLLRFHANDLLRLHLGCGDRFLEGYVNIDCRKTSATDLVCDIKKLPYPNNSVQDIETYHVIEHLSRHDLPEALREWYRVLSPGGRLIIECPDFDAAVKEYVEGNEQRLDSIFGLQRFPGDAHLFGYNFARLKNLLQIIGFVAIERKDAQDYHTTHEPCLRVETLKEPGK